jgi:hypothetical protein
MIQTNYNGAKMVGGVIKNAAVASVNKIEAWREDGQKYFKEYPFTAAYNGKMNIVLGDLKG